MEPNKIVVIRPLRFLWLVPILLLQSLFENTTTGLLYGVLMMLITYQFFPTSEVIDINKRNKDR